MSGPSTNPKLIAGMALRHYECFNFPQRTFSIITFNSYIMLCGLQPYVAICRTKPTLFIGLQKFFSVLIKTDILTLMSISNVCHQAGSWFDFLLLSVKTPQILARSTKKKEHKAGKSKVKRKFLNKVERFLFA